MIPWITEFHSNAKFLKTLRLATHNYRQEKNQCKCDQSMYNLRTLFASHSLFFCQHHISPNNSFLSYISQFASSECRQRRRIQIITIWFMLTEMINYLAVAVDQSFPCTSRTILSRHQKLDSGTPTKVFICPERPTEITEMPQTNKPSRYDSYRPNTQTWHHNNIQYVFSYW
jgi:hypothetical protein